MLNKKDRKMKREGRQHGMVRSYPILPSPWNPRPESRHVNRFDSPPTSGMFTKVSSKPTNHSKFTGKCGRPKCVGCHLHPACKSKLKAKGTQKERSRDVAGLVSWLVVDGKPGLKFAGSSATVLDHLDNDHLDEEFRWTPRCTREGSGSSNDWSVETDDNDDDDDENMSFCDVGSDWEQVDGDEGWCLVGGL